METDAHTDLADGDELAAIDANYRRIDGLFAQAGKLRTVHAAHGEAYELAHANGCAGRDEHQHPASRDVNTSARQLATGGAMVELNVRRQRVAPVLPAFRQCLLAHHELLASGPYVIIGRMPAQLQAIHFRRVETWKLAAIAFLPPGEYLRIAVGRNTDAPDANTWEIQMADRLHRIGILTGGGDCPGLNAVIRAVAKAAMDGGLEVVGIEDGYLGLIENRLRALSYDDVSGILTRGGTILGSCNKANPAEYAVPDGQGGWEIMDVRDQVAENYHQAGLDAMVVIGGDGTMSGAAQLIGRGLNIVGVPKTIDNDLWATEVTFGHDTAVQTAVDALDKVHTTASSHHRVMVVELMGRYAGWIALHAGVASGADVILIPEIPFDIKLVAKQCLKRSHVGKGFTIIAVGEGATPAGGDQFVDQIVENSPDPIRLGGVARFIAHKIEEMIGLDSRAIVLGHVQRGGTPSAFDRVLATKFGYHAYELLAAEKFGQLVVQHGGLICSVPISEVADKVRTVPPDDLIIRAARAVGTCFGD